MANFEIINPHQRYLVVILYQFDMKGFVRIHFRFVSYLAQCETSLDRCLALILSELAFCRVLEQFTSKFCVL